MNATRAEAFLRSLSLTHMAPLIKSVVVILLGHAAIRLGGRVIDATGFPSKVSQEDSATGRRARTVRGMLKSILRFTTGAVVILVILDLLGFETRSVLAGAGILGIIVGLGSQSLIRDVIAGVFILYEDQFNVGDHVTIGGNDGVIEEMGLTVGRIRDFNGDIHFIRYGTIERVTNHSRGRIRAWVDVPVSIEEAPQRVMEALAEVCRLVAGSGGVDGGEGSPGGPSVLGITALDGYRVVYTVVGKAEPGKQWAMEREVRKRVVEVFQGRRIKAPDPYYVRLSPEAATRGQAGDSDWTDLT